MYYKLSLDLKHVVLTIGMIESVVKTTWHIWHHICIPFGDSDRYFDSSFLDTPIQGVGKGNREGSNI